MFVSNYIFMHSVLISFLLGLLYSFETLSFVEFFASHLIAENKEYHLHIAFFEKLGMTATNQPGEKSNMLAGKDFDEPWDNNI